MNHPSPSAVVHPQKAVSSLPIRVQAILTNSARGVSQFVRQKVLPLLPQSHARSEVLEEIRARFQNPAYLNSPSAIQDFDTLLTQVYNRRLSMYARQGKNENTRRELLRLVLYLRNLSNNSGLIARRKSGETAFSHWIEAAFIYLENDPEPTLFWLKEMAIHDALEDPDFSQSKRDHKRWGSITEVRNSLVKYAGEKSVSRVERHLTKPMVNVHHFDGIVQAKWNIFASRGNFKEAEDYISGVCAENPDALATAKHARNREYLEDLRSAPDDIFREKLADSLSNVRNMDAFILSHGDRHGKAKIARKCQEICDYFLSRALKTAASYYIQLTSEIESLQETYWFSVQMHGHSSKSANFSKAIRIAFAQGIRFVRHVRVVDPNSRKTRAVLEARRVRF